MSRAGEEKAARIEQLVHDGGFTFVHFKGADMMSGPGTNGFVPFDSRRFGLLCHTMYGNTLSENMVKDFAKTVQTISPDWSDRAHLITFGQQTWDMKRLAFTDNTTRSVYSSPCVPNKAGRKSAWEFILQLTQGDEALGHDVLQGIAPLFMHRKPSGIIWFIGDGANGKSALISAIYRIMGGKHLSSMTLAAIELGTGTLALSGILGNIVREASEQRVTDSEKYKAIGTHEPFSERRLYTQEMPQVDTNFHTIFNTNTIPTFADKTLGARRRTLPIHFMAHFQDDPLFEDKTFTPEFLGGLLTLILEEAVAIKDRGYKYAWSDSTRLAKQSYDSEVNSTEAFVEYLRDRSIVGFTNYKELYFRYVNWAEQEGLSVLLLPTLKKTVSRETGALSKPTRVDGQVSRRFYFADVFDSEQELVWVDNAYGLVKPFEQPEPTQLSIEEAAKHDW